MFFYQCDHQFSYRNLKQKKRSENFILLSTFLPILSTKPFISKTFPISLTPFLTKIICKLKVLPPSLPQVRGSPLKRSEDFSSISGVLSSINISFCHCSLDLSLCKFLVIYHWKILRNRY